MRVGLFLFLLFYFSASLWAYDQLDQEENNEFGGRTIIFQDHKKGIFRGKNFYDSGGAIMRQDRAYTEEYALSTGIARKTMDFLFDVKTKETLYYTKKYQALRLVSHRVTYFEQATGTLQKKENHFVIKNMGYSVEYFDMDAKLTRMEWVYPNNIEGLAKKITHYDEQGHVTKIEGFYTPRTQKKEGLQRSVFINEGGKKKTREWFYTPEFAQSHDGAIRKLVEYIEHPSQETRPQKNWFNQKNELVRPNVKMPTPVGE